MNTTNISQYTGIPQRSVDRFLKMSSADIFEDPEYQKVLETLNREYLEETLPHARAAYEKGLPAFREELERKTGLQDTVMSAYTLGNWLVGVLRYPQTTNTILKMHERVPSSIIVSGLQTLVEMLDDLPEGREEWQRALVILSIPLMVMDH